MLSFGIFDAELAVLHVPPAGLALSEPPVPCQPRAQYTRALGSMYFISFVIV